MYWQTDDFWRWYSMQPEMQAIDQHRAEEDRRRAWQVRKLENKIDRQAERLQRSGFSERQIHALKRVAGVSREQLMYELATGH